MISVFDMTQNIVRKGKTFVSAFSPFPALFSTSCLTLSQTTNFQFFQTSLQVTILGLMKMVECSPKEKKTLREKEKLLIISNFSFSHSVFKRLLLQTKACLRKG